MKPIVDTLNKERPASGAKTYKIHHDNARPHVHKSVDNFLKEHGINKIENLPYSPDLAQSDFLLFSYIKDRLNSHSIKISLHNQITMIVKEIDRKKWLKTFDKWAERMEACIKYKGEYSEYLNKFY